MPLTELVLPARSRIRATIGALVAMLIVVASGDSPVRGAGATRPYSII